MQKTTKVLETFIDEWLMILYRKVLALMGWDLFNLLTYIIIYRLNNDFNGKIGYNIQVKRGVT